MWLCVDRREGRIVVLSDDREGLYRLPLDRYLALTGREPEEADVLAAEVVEGEIRSATYDEAETVARRLAARRRLSRLFGGD